MKAYVKRTHHVEISAHFGALYPSDTPCPQRKALEAMIEAKIERGKTFKELRDDVADHCKCILKYNTDEVTRVFLEYNLDEKSIEMLASSTYFFPTKMPVGPLRGL